MSAMKQGTPVGATIPPEIAKNLMWAYGLRRPEPVERVDTTALHPEQWSKKQRLFEMLKQRPMSHQDIISALSATPASAISLISDLRQMGLNVSSWKRGDERVYSAAGLYERGRLRPKRRSNRSRLQALHIDAIEQTLIEVLRGMGGAGFTASVRSNMQERLAPHLRSHDLQQRAAYQRWWYRVLRARSFLIAKGIMKSNSPSGYWELA